MGRDLMTPDRRAIPLTQEIAMKFEARNFRPRPHTMPLGVNLLGVEITCHKSGSEQFLVRGRPDIARSVEPPSPSTISRLQRAAWVPRTGQICVHVQASLMERSAPGNTLEPPVCLADRASYCSQPQGSMLGRSSYHLDGRILPATRTVALVASTRLALTGRSE